MNVKPTLVRLKEGQAERIDALRGANRQAEFIREAVDEKLRREERKKARAKRPD